jgi:Flp pilus assembly protein TadD
VTFALVAIVAVAFSSCPGNDFVCWDDQENFLSNPSYRGVGWPQLRWAWTTFRVGVYQPLAWMLLGAQYSLFGLRPWGYHLTSLIIYVLNTVVLYALVVSLLSRCRNGLAQGGPTTLAVASGLAVGLFAIHPLRTEVVAWASCQPYLPCAFFSMLTVLAYLRAFPEGEAERRCWLCVAFCCFAAALLSKAVAVGLPAILLILDVYPLGRLGGAAGRSLGLRVWREKVPFLGLSVIFMVVAYVAREDARHLAPVEGRSVSASIAQACYAVCFYPIKTILPWSITAYYPIPERLGLAEWPFMPGFLVTLGVSLGLLLWRKTRPGPACAWLSYLVLLAPTSGMVRIGSQIAADRYSYISMMGLLVLFAAGLCRLFRTVGRRGSIRAGLVAVSAALLLGLVHLTRSQCRTWQTSERLWSHVLDHGAGRDFMALKIMGAILLVQGRNEEALARLTDSKRLRPDYADTRYNLGLALSRQGRLDEAMSQYSEAVQLDPRHLDALANLGVMLSRQGRFEEAARRFTKVLQLGPDHVNAHYNLGLILSHWGRSEPARVHLAEAVRLDPGNPNAHANLGVVLARLGRFEEAVPQLEEAVRLDPGNVDARSNLGVVLSRLGRIATRPGLP